jgi:hypothetical protein
MVLCFGLATYAILEGMDLRLIRYSAPEEKCAALGLCRDTTELLLQSTERSV